MDTNGFNNGSKGADKVPTKVAGVSKLLTLVFGPMLMILQIIKLLVELVLK